MALTTRLYSVQGREKQQKNNEFVTFCHSAALFVHFSRFSVQFWAILFANIFVRFGTFFAHVSVPTTTTTTKLLLGPLSVARGQKLFWLILCPFYNLHLNVKNCIPLTVHYTKVERGVIVGQIEFASFMDTLKCIMRDL